MSRDVENLVEILWEAFEAADNCLADREMDIIDTGGNYESFRMRQIAEHVLRAQEEMRTIWTEDQLARLPFLSIVRERPTHSGGVWERRTSGWHKIAGGQIAQRTPRLPALLLYVPETPR